MGVQFAGNILASSAGGPLPISMGGTGQTNSIAAINALLPSQTGQNTKVLTTDGTNVSWQAAGGGGGTPGGANTQIQFNDSGSFGGSANFTINKTTGALSALSTFTASKVYSSGTAASVRSVGLQTAGADRWLLSADAAAESGSNAGSDFELVRVADNGATTNQVLTVSRATGVTDFKVTPTINSLQVGYLTVPQNSQGTYTCVLSDSGKHLYTSSGGATWTIPSNASVAYPIGTAITFVNQSSTSCTIAITTDTMYLAGAGTTGSRTLGTYGFATALKVSATSWIISGTSLT